MIYGRESCGYLKLIEFLKEHKNQGNFYDIFTYYIGRSGHYETLAKGDKQDYTSDNRLIENKTRRIGYRDSE